MRAGSSILATGVTSISLAVCGLFVGIAGTGCAAGESEPGATPDKCKLRDCGPSSGGDVDPLDGDELDTNFLDEDTNVDDTGASAGDTKVTDTGSAGDTKVTDTGSAIDTGSPADTSTCTIPAGKVCGWVPQCGCKTTENCDFTALDGTVSCISAGSVDVNGKCATSGLCKKGLTCVGGICQPFCGTLSDCTGTGVHHCTQIQGGTPAKDIPGLKVCTTQCDLRAPAAACGTAGCQVLDASAGTTACTSAGTATTKGSCTTDPLLCAPGYTCVTIGTATTSDCLPWCRVGVSGDCTGIKTCTGFSTPIVIGTYTYGVCN